MLAYGLRIGVRTTNPEIQAELGKLIPYGAKIIAKPQVETIYSLKVGGVGKRPGLKLFNLAFAGATQIARSLNLPDTLEALERDLQLYVAENARNRVFVHAGVLGWKNQAILIPGSSLSGKSTLVRELVKAGATYLSDEFAVLDAHGRVHPYPLPIGVRKNLNERQEKYPIQTFGGIVGTKPLPVGLVLVTQYQQGSHWKPKHISAGQGLLELLANTISAQRNPAKALATLQQVVLKAPVLKGTRGETDEVVEALLTRPWPTL